MGKLTFYSRIECIKFVFLLLISVCECIHLIESTYGRLLDTRERKVLISRKIMHFFLIGGCGKLYATDNQTFIKCWATNSIWCQKRERIFVADTFQLCKCTRNVILNELFIAAPSRSDNGFWSTNFKRYLHACLTVGMLFKGEQSWSPF